MKKKTRVIGSTKKQMPLFVPAKGNLLDAPDPSVIRQTRKALNLSQSGLAQLFNVSTRAVQAWESGARRPDGPAIVLFKLLPTRPDLPFAIQALREGRG